MSSIGSATTSSTSSGTLGDAPPVSFPGVASGIDYNSIIEKYTAETLQQEKPTQAQINNLNSANTAVLKIQNLLGAVQDSLTSLSDPTVFNAFKASVGNNATGSPVATATQISGQSAIPGNYQINSQTAATSTEILSNPSAGAPLNNPTSLSTSNAIGTQGTAITPSNGTNATGSLTINGVSVTYNVTQDSLQTILNRIQADVPGVTATFNQTTQQVTLTGVTSIGSGGDSGNLLQVLKLDTAQVDSVDPNAAISSDNLQATPTSGNIVINGTAVAYTTGQSLNTIVANINAAGIAGVTASISGNQVTINGVTSLANSGGGNLTTALGLTTSGTTATSAPLTGSSVTSSSAISGINAVANLNSPAAGFKNAVTAGTFTINGVQFTVNPTTTALSDVINQINASSAGVTAYFNPSTDQISLTNKTSGPQSIVLGSASDTSNFLAATGLTAKAGYTSGGQTVSGTQASVTYTDTTGVHTVYSNTNDFTTVIPGIDLNVTATSTSGYTVSVSTDPSKAEAAINSFITAYNAAITELNKDTAPPQVSTGTSTTGTSTSASSGGGVLYNNFQITDLRDQLVQLVSGFIPSGSSSYNSLASVGITLDTAQQSVGASSDSSDSTNASDSSGVNDSSFSVSATSGKLAALNTTAFEAAYSANTAAVASLFTNVPAATLSASQIAASGQSYGFSYQFGELLSNSNGLATSLANTIITPTSGFQSSLLNQVVDSNNQEIANLQQSIDLINQEATNQADALRAQYSASESQIAELQALQGQISAIGH